MPSLGRKSPVSAIRMEISRTFLASRGRFASRVSPTRMPSSVWPSGLATEQPSSINAPSPSPQINNWQVPEPSISMVATCPMPNLLGLRRRVRDQGRLQSLAKHGGLPGQQVRPPHPLFILEVVVIGVRVVLRRGAGMSQRLVVLLLQAGDSLADGFDAIACHVLAWHYTLEPGFATATDTGDNPGLAVTDGGQTGLGRQTPYRRSRRPRLAWCPDGARRLTLRFLFYHFFPRCRVGFRNDSISH